VLCRFFTVQTSCNVVLLSTLLLPLFSSLQLSGLTVSKLTGILSAQPADFKYASMNLTVALLCSALNMLYVGPLSTDLMFESLVIT